MKTKLAEGKKQDIRGIAALLFLVLLVFLGLLWVMEVVFPGLLPLIRSGNEPAIEAYIKKEGEWKGMLCIFVLGYLQMISIFLPSLPIHVAAGAIYGWWKGSLLCYLSFVSGNATVFFFARHLGKRVEDLIPGMEKENWLRKKMNSANPGVVAAMGCLLPGIPNGLVPYIASRSRISLKGFTEAIAATCWLQVLINCSTGHFLIRRYYLQAGGMFLLQLAIIGLIAWKREEILGRFQ